LSAPTTAWDRSARAYDRFEGRWHYYGRVAEKLLRPLKLEPDSRVLELAGGTGACTVLLSRRCPVGMVVCVDGSSEMLQIAKKNLEGAGSRNVVFVRGDVAHLSMLVEGPFDFVVCNSAFWQFADLRSVLESVRGALKPGGTLAFNMPQWFRTKRERLAYRKTVEGVLLRHKIDPSKFWAGRRPPAYAALLKRSGFVVTRNTHYWVELREKEREDWKRIPVFAGRPRNYSEVPAKVSVEIRRELEKRRRMPWPKGSAQRRRWRRIVAMSGTARQ